MVDAATAQCATNRHREESLIGKGLQTAVGRDHSVARSPWNVSKAGELYAADYPILPCGILSCACKCSTAGGPRLHQVFIAIQPLWGLIKSLHKVYIIQACQDNIHTPARHKRTKNGETNTITKRQGRAQCESKSQKLASAAVSQKTEMSQRCGHFENLKRMTTHVMLSIEPRLKASVHSLLALASASLTLQARRTASSFETTSHSPSLARIKHCAPCRYMCR